MKRGRFRTGVLAVPEAFDRSARGVPRPDQWVCAYPKKAETFHLYFAAPVAEQESTR
jgi:hypothetical protein